MTIGINQRSSKMPVRVKGVGDSLWVTLDTTHPVDYLKKQTGKLFERLRDLTINARVVLDPGTPDGHDDLISEIENYLKETFHVGLVTRHSKPVILPAEEISQNNKEEIKNPADINQEIKEDINEEVQEKEDDNERSNVLFMSGRIRSGQKIITKYHLTIMGDVNPGAEIIAGGDILVMGSLRGTAVAGQPDNEKAIVLALDFRPTQIQIGGLVAAGLPPLPESKAEFAQVKNGKIVVEEYLKTRPFGDLHFPQIRKC